jgi:tRNA (guanine37-N1)-methyltransferase
MDGSINKEMFKATLNLLAIKIPSKSCNAAMLSFQGYLFDRPKFKKIYPVPHDPSSRYLVLAENIKDKDSMENAMPSELIQLIDRNEYTIENFDLNLTYEHMSVDEVLKKVLPESSIKDIPSAFEQIGHIAHLNLRDEALPFKRVIGKLFLTKT